jgi:hypothetical protein
MSESKKDRFVRIAEKRTNKVIQMIRLLGNCSNKATYEYSSDQIRKIFGTIESELKIARVKFSNTPQDRFSLK